MPAKYQTFGVVRECRSEEFRHEAQRRVLITLAPSTYKFHSSLR